MGNNKEASARIKINKLLEESGWRFFDDENSKANIQLEGKITYTKEIAESLGNDFENSTNKRGQGGAMDYLLLDSRGFPVCVVEAKKSTIHPLSAKDQSYKYAISSNTRFIILTNGDSHYLWDTLKGHPEVITVFPGLESLEHRQSYNPNPEELNTMPVDSTFLQPSKTLRDYQVAAIKAIQEATKKGKNKYLLEMATGTGKTTVAGAVCKLFLKSGNAKRILFLVDRIELETQAVKAFKGIFGELYNIDTIKSNQWNKCEIVVSTIQTLMTNNRYKELFSPADFELVISDEAHRGLSGNSRAVFEYFIGYKLGLTATPKDYLKGVDFKELEVTNPKLLELRNLRDTYKTFGCDDQSPTFRYDLNKGVNDGFLLPPYAIDARSEVTTELLSQQGIVVDIENEEVTSEQTYKIRDFERRFFNEATNVTFCRALLEKGLKDPFTGEFGKTLVFCVSQNHAAKITNLLCKLADEYFPNKYKDSNFALQVTSSVAKSQSFTENFSENKLNGNSQFASDIFPDYKTSKTRICITVGMMTTGYDCPDLLNVALMRPVYSPSDFIQMKGRGTRKHDFNYAETGEIKAKEQFLLLDFFANCEYFEKDFDYREKLKLNVAQTNEPVDGNGGKKKDKKIDYDAKTNDKISQYIEIVIGNEGMKVDRELYPELKDQFEQVITSHEALKQAREDQDINSIVATLQEEVLDKPNEYWTVAKIRESYLKKNPEINRRITIKEMILKALGIIDRFKERDERIAEEYDKFVDIYKLEVQPPQRQNTLRNFFENYLSDTDFRKIIDEKKYGLLNNSPIMSFDQFKDISQYRYITTNYIQEYLVSETKEFDWQV
ncbi:MAG: DEAD/DEAH box helicase family protein [bacterium]